MGNSIAEIYLDETRTQFRNYKAMAEKAMAQVDAGEFFALLDAEANSIALIAKHLAGNMRSRWHDFLNSDGEKPDRQRDREFIIEGEDRAAIMRQWEEGWQCLLETLEALTPSDLNRIVFIRGEAHTVLKAISRQQSHYAYHIGQIVLLAKHFKLHGWQTLSIPRGASETFNKEKWQK